jgi:hypothetical protein
VNPGRCLRSEGNAQITVVQFNPHGSGVQGQSGTPCSMNIRGHLCPSKRESSGGPMQDRIALGLLGEVEIKLDQTSSAWLLPAQR